MTSIEETGKSIEEATEKALEQLRVTEDEVDVEILEEPARGFLGLGQSPARVRVTVKRKQAPEPAPRSAQRERPQRQRPAREERPPRQEQGPREERPQRQRPPREERPKRPEPAPQQAEAPAPAPTPAPEAPRPAEPVAEIPSGEVMKVASEISVEVLQRIVDSIEDGARVAVKNAADGQLTLEVTSADPATIIGKHGQTVDAIQYLVGVITNKRLPEKIRLVVDVEGYRTRREEILRGQAAQLAARVKESGEEAVLEPLHANERRIIHTALADDPDVYTYSEGEEPERYVVISPKK